MPKWERSGSVGRILDHGSKLLVSFTTLSKALYPLLIILLVQPRKTWLKIVDWDVKNQNQEASKQKSCSNPFHSWYQWTGTLANSEDLDEMPHKATFHEGLHCLLKIKTIFRDRNTLFYGFFDSNPSKYKMKNSIMYGIIYQSEKG